MQAWRPAVLGLMASCQWAGSQDVHHVDLEEVTQHSDAGNDHLGIARQLSDYTAACPRVLRNSLNACDRCISNEMCPYDTSASKQWICNSAIKRCTDPDWDANETSHQCPENAQDYSAWSAMCKYICEEQQAPFDCAVYCLNEDYPCKWVPDCHASNEEGGLKGMTPDSKTCLRPCADHDSMLQVSLKFKGLREFDNCPEAAAFFGCNNPWGADILEHCPHTCRRGGSTECAWRCGRDEIPTEDGQQCWQVVEDPVDTYSCAQAISAGFDCHCKCAGAYLQLARGGGGSFKADAFYGDETVGFNKTIVANTTFDISLSGQAMNVKDVQDAWGPRMKLVMKGQSCMYARLIEGLSGLECVAPPPGSASATTASTCVTPPSKYSPYMHRWTKLRIDHCGSYDVCHCNTQCDLTKNWHHAGSIDLVPPTEVGSVSKAMPGCQREVPQLEPAGDQQPVEKLVHTVSTTTLKLHGGISEANKKYALHAAKQALVPILKSFSGLLKRDVPKSDDIKVESATRRLHEESELPRMSFDFLAVAPSISEQPRWLSDPCFDDDAAFAVEAAKVFVQFQSCADLLASNNNDVDIVCTETSLQAAIVAGCQKTCKLCAELTTTTTTEGPTMPPDVKETSSIEIDVTVTSHTDASAANVHLRLAQIKNDPVPFIQRLFVELEDTEMPANEIPRALWIVVTSGPLQEIILPEEKVEEKETFTTTSIIFVVLGGAIGGSVLVGLLFVLCWYCVKRRDKYRKVAPITAPVREVQQVSEGGYRVKKVQVGGEQLEQQPAQPDCFERCCARCYKRCCKKKLKKAQAFSQNLSGGSSDPANMTVGSRVKLHGLNQAHFNGLCGTILSGPNEKGRYEVDLIVVDDHSIEEHQTLSFKPDNIMVIPPSEGDAEPRSPEEPKLKSYRSAPVGPHTFAPGGS